MIENTVLIVDDEPHVSQAVSRVLKSDGYQILTASSGDEALSIMKNNDVQLIISDQKMPNMCGTDLLEKIKKSSPKTARLLLSGDIDNKTLQQCVESGIVQRYIPKPWNNQVLKLDVGSALSICQLRRKTADLTQILNSSNNAMLMLSADAEIISCNNTFTEMTNIKKSSILGHKVGELVEGMEGWEEIRRSCCINKRWQGSGKCFRLKQSPLSVSMMLRHIIDADEANIFCLWLSDQTESEMIKANSVFQHFFHPITQLPGLLLFKKSFTPKDANSAVQTSSFLLIYLCVNGLDHVKSSFGYVVADTLLKNISQRLLNVVQDQGVLTHLRNDEFVIKMQPQAKYSDCSYMAKVLINSLRTPVKADNNAIFVTVNAGLGGFNTNETTVENALQAVCSAAGKSREIGMNRMQWHKKDQVKLLCGRYEQQKALYKGLLERGFTSIYAPRVSIDGKQLKAYETSLAWKKSDSDIRAHIELLDSPADLPQLYCALNRLFIEMVFSDVKDMMASNRVNIPVSIPLCELYCQDEGLISDLSMLLEVTEVDPKLIEFQISDRLLKLQPKTLYYCVSKLHSMKFGLALICKNIDKDFVGFVVKSPISGLILPSWIIRSLSSNSISRALFKMLQGCAAEKGIPLIAQGVETKEELKYLRSNHCDQVQGIRLGIDKPSMKV
ncbi:MAG: response regulator [Pseudomonadales bacterium]|nr:response regulator [Pseudomonadales bacterium]